MLNGPWVFTWRNTENQQVSTHQAAAPADTRSSHQTPGLIEIDYHHQGHHKYHHPSPVILSLMNGLRNEIPFKTLEVRLLLWYVQHLNKASDIVLDCCCHLVLFVYLSRFSQELSKSPPDCLWLAKGTFVFIHPVSVDKEWEIILFLESIVRKYWLSEGLNNIMVDISHVMMYSKEINMKVTINSLNVDIIE